MDRLPSPLRRRALVAPSLLLALALGQIAGHARFHLSPWKGGGFGMFSSNDHGGFRGLRVFELGASGERPVPLPETLERLQRQVLEVPRQGNLERLASELRAETPGLGVLRVEVWRTQFASADLRPERVLVARAVCP